MSMSIVTPFAGQTADLIPDYAAATRGAQIIIVDNGCPPETAAVLAGVADIAGNVYIRNETNVGFAVANNQGYARATGDIVIFLNSDVAGNPAWLDAAAADIRDGALYGPSVAQQLVYGMWLPYLEGWCIGATKKTWEQLTGWDIDGPWDDESYPGPYWEDNDLCLRAWQAGLDVVQTGWGNYLTHKGGRTTGNLIKHGDSFERNRATFAARVRAVWEAQAR